MNEIFIKHNSIDTLNNELQSLEGDDSVSSILLFMADKDHYSDEEIAPILKKITKPLIGGIFPEIIFKGERKKTGILLIPLNLALNTQLIDLSLSCEAIFKSLEKQQSKSFNTESSLFVFYDALSDGKETLIETLFNFFGVNPTYLGGGAGSLDFINKPCIITNNGMFQNTAVIAWSTKKIDLGVAHGWKSISTSLKVTEVSKNKVSSINYKPAFEVYKEIVEAHSGMQFNDSNFFDIAKSYPIGVSRMDAEKIVRDPFMVTENTIHFIDAIPEGSYIEVLHGNIESLLNGAQEARTKAIPNNLINSFNLFCIDCISRVLFMQDDFDKELKIIKNGSNAFGILSIGEIANSDSIIEIYNKTIVFALW